MSMPAEHTTGVDSAAVTDAALPWDALACACADCAEALLRCHRDAALTTRATRASVFCATLEEDARRRAVQPAGTAAAPPLS